MASLKAMVHLPTYVALKATYGGAPFKYLGVEDDGKLAYTTDKVVSDRAKFAVEPAGDGIAHIRSCYNNKYWVRSSESENWIVAAAKDPKEDKTAWNCTLFTANVSNDGKTVKFVHVQLGKTVGRRDVASDREMYLCLEPLATIEDVSDVVDYETIVILPQYVAFKDQYGSYLNNSGKYNDFSEDYTFVVFASNDIGERGNLFEIGTNSEGFTYVKDVDGKWWESTGVRCEDLVMLKSHPAYPCFLYSVYSVGKDIVALRNLENNNFLERFRYRGGRGHDFNALRANSDTITNECRLQIVDPVLVREVNVFQFHLDRARIYGFKPLILAEQVADNPSAYENETTLQFTYTKTTTKTWNTSKSGAVTVKAIITGGVPFIEEGTLEIGLELKIQCDMGGSVSESEQVQSSYTAKVPPHTKVTVTAVSTQGTCDVPFSYDQVDHMPNGDIKRTTLSDGVYTGINSYHFEYHVKYEPL